MKETGSSFTHLLLSSAMETARDNISLEDFISLSEVSAGFHDELGFFDAEEQKRYVIRLAVAMARDALPVWTESHPGRAGPVDAVTQAERWSASPCEEFAEMAAAMQPAAVQESLRVWRQEPKTAAWAARTAAWAADAPKYGWQAICALMGAQLALGADRALSSAIRFHNSEKQREISGSPRAADGL